MIHWVRERDLLEGERLVRERTDSAPGIPAHGHIIGQPNGIHDGAVVTPARHAIDKEAAAAVAANVGERNRIEGLGLAWSHGDPKYGLS